MAATGELFINEHRISLHSLAQDLIEEDPKMLEILSKEEIIHITTSKLNRSKLSIKVYVFTDLATVISFTYFFQSQESTKSAKREGVNNDPQRSRFQKLKQYSIRNLSISDHLKQMTGFKLSKIIAGEKYPV